MSLETLRWVKFPILNDGFVTLVDAMGTDASIVQAARVSYNKDVRSENAPDDEKLLRFMMRHGHTSPFEMCEIKVLFRIPMDAWRQLVRHRTASINEWSTRFTEAIDSRATTPPQDWRLQATANKQGSDGFLSDWTDETRILNANLSHPYSTPNEYLTAKEQALHNFAQSVYDERLSLGIAREQARKDLPLSTYTEAYWKIDLHNLLHFLEKRLDPSAQQEIRLYAKALAEMVRDLWPQTFKAFEDYRLNSLKLSALDVSFIRRMISELGSLQIQDLATDMGLLEHHFSDKRERSECLVKLTRLGFISE